jgi:hypothetical protein
MYKLRTFKRRSKLWIGRHILNIAEALPTFNGGFIQHLQGIRKHSREDADKDFERTRLPKDGKLVLSTITLYQVYPIEDLDILTDSIEREFGNDVFKRTFDTIKSLRSSENHLFGGSHYVLGHISRDKSGFFYPLGYKVYRH